MESISRNEYSGKEEGSEGTVFESLQKSETNEEADSDLAITLSKRGGD
ncbi:hypothetical protein [Leptospira borgpetersenii]|nr:hypothetical protein [Leptospira borgpetersenii]